MRTINKNLRTIVITTSLVLYFVSGMSAFAVSAPSLGVAATFGVLASTYTNIAAGSISGDLGYTTPPAPPPAVSGTTYVADSVYNQAGLDQNAALANLNGMTCDFIFGAATDLSLLPQPLIPGVYCIAGAMSIGAPAGITLNGAGLYVFRSTGAFNTIANSTVTLIGGASACNVFWTPGAATTLGANSTFIGTLIDIAGITVGSTVTWTGRALAFGGTVTTDTDTITVLNCAPAPAAFHVVKQVVNTGGGTAAVSSFNLYVKNSGVNVAGSPANGAGTPGTAYSLAAGTYVVSEDANASYTQNFSGDCSATGSIILTAGDDKTCTVTNTFIPKTTSGGGGWLSIDTCPSGDFSSSYYDGICGTAPIATGTTPIVVPLIGITKIPDPLALPSGPGKVTYNYTIWNVGEKQALTSITVVDDTCGPLVFVSGDINNNSKLDISEKWKYSCSSILTKTTTNTVMATGYSDDIYHQPAVATAVATVVVGTSSPAPLINVVKVPSRLTPFPFGGGTVLYTYTVTNPGVVAMHNVDITDDKCSPMTFLSGDVNKNDLLDTNETWTYACQAYIRTSTRNTVTVKGEANGFTAWGYAFANVLVSRPRLPNTGLPPEEKNTSEGIILLSGILALAGAASVITLKKRKS